MAIEASVERIYDRLVFVSNSDVNREVCFVMTDRKTVVLPGGAKVSVRDAINMMEKNGYHYRRLEAKQY